MPTFSRSPRRSRTDARRAAHAPRATTQRVGTPTRIAPAPPARPFFRRSLAVHAAAM
ncbi:hypothetical protein DM49_3050 [Burkholderia mallei]|nr:hypothetical protein DM46_1942 [Burkholderia mallei]KOS93085.1 hypothetical protein DM45_3091 [Burkholderia mallei]KOS96920.1 hypothetical protein DM49_3050 [Burkholderia mallei]